MALLSVRGRFVERQPRCTKFFWTMVLIGIMIQFLWKEDMNGEFTNVSTGLLGENSLSCFVECIFNGTLLPF